MLLYTSGTAGSPKGAMLTHRALLANQGQVAAVDPPIINPDDVVLLALPLFHIFGLNAGLVAVAYHGARGVLVEQFEPARTLDVIARHQVSVVAAVPQMYVAWSSQPDLGDHLASLRVAVSGAAPLDAAVARRFLETTRHPIFEGYGLTETAPVRGHRAGQPGTQGAVDRPTDPRRGGEACRAPTAPRSPPSPATDHAVTWWTTSTTTRAGCRAPIPGEIVVRGANLFAGYWPDGAGGPDADGWWPTGDVAYADADGDLFLVDRLGELILVSGFNVYPHEVELVLTGAPGHRRGRRVRGAGPDHRRGGDRPTLCAAEGGGSVHEELREHCERNLARFKCPKVIEFVAELPHSAIGKVRKATLRANLQAAR